VGKNATVSKKRAKKEKTQKTQNKIKTVADPKKRFLSCCVDFVYTCDDKREIASG
jgi:hypothetical protein